MVIGLYNKRSKIRTKNCPKNCRMVIGFLTKGRVRISYKVFQLTSLKVLMCVWILFILLKTENNKKNNFQITVHAQNTVHVP